MAAAEDWPLAGQLLGWAWMAFGLHVLGVWLESRPTALGLEWARLLLNLPVLWLAQQLALLPAGAEAWALLALYGLLSLLGIYLPRLAEGWRRDRLGSL